MQAQAGQAAVDVAHDVHASAGRPRLQHVLDQVDAPARAVELVAEQQERRAGRGAEPAMHAGPQHRVGRRGVGVAQLLGGEIGLHAPQFLVGGSLAEQIDHDAEPQQTERRRIASDECSPS